jgi:hypothetical protein
LIIYFHVQRHEVKENREKDEEGGVYVQWRMHFDISPITPEIAMRRIEVKGVEDVAQLRIVLDRLAAKGRIAPFGEERYYIPRQ